MKNIRTISLSLSAALALSSVVFGGVLLALTHMLLKVGW